MTLEDLPAVLGLLESFVRDYYHGLIPYSPDAWTELVVLVVAHESAWVLVEEGRVIGLLAAVVAPLPSSGLRAAIECAWYVDPLHRGPSSLRLWHAFDAWAEAQSVDVIHVTHPSSAPRTLVDFYIRQGFVELETTWQKVLPP